MFIGTWCMLTRKSFSLEFKTSLLLNETISQPYLHSFCSSSDIFITFMSDSKANFNTTLRQDSKITFIVRNCYSYWSTDCEKSGSGFFWNARECNFLMSDLWEMNVTADPPIFLTLARYNYAKFDNQALDFRSWN